MNTVNDIRARLQALQPSVLELHDESHLHAGHAGAASGGGHYQLMIVANAFLAQSRVARQRTVFGLLADLLPDRIHALSITALTPDEHASARLSAP